MTDLLSLLLVVAVLVAALSVMLRGARPPTGEGRAGARRPQAFRRYREPGLTEPVGLLLVALGGLAIGSLTGRASSAAGIGVLVGIAVLVSVGLAELTLGVIGVVASAQAAIQVMGTGCWTVPPLVRWSTVGLVVAVFAVTFLVGRHLPGNRRSTCLAAGGLGLFAVLEVVAFLVSPLGVPIAVSGPGAVGMSVVAATAFGLGSGYAPVLGPLLLGIAASIVGAGAEALVGQACAAGAATGGLVAAMAFTAVAGGAVVVRRSVAGGAAVRR